MSFLHTFKVVIHIPPTKRTYPELNWTLRFRRAIFYPLNYRSVIYSIRVFITLCKKECLLKSPGKMIMQCLYITFTPVIRHRLFLCLNLTDSNRSSLPKDNERATDYTKDHQQWRAGLFFREKTKVSHSQPSRGLPPPHISMYLQPYTGDLYLASIIPLVLVCLFRKKVVSSSCYVYPYPYLCKYL